MSKMISVASGFQYSVNIGYDLTNDDKLKNFIPTKSALDLLEEFRRTETAADEPGAKGREVPVVEVLPSENGVEQCRHRAEHSTVFVLNEGQ